MRSGWRLLARAALTRGRDRLRRCQGFSLLQDRQFEEAGHRFTEAIQMNEMKSSYWAHRCALASGPLPHRSHCRRAPLPARF